MDEKEGYIIVTPGTLVSMSEKSGEGTFVFNGKTHSKYLGIKKEGYRINVAPFKQVYKPKNRDKVIGQIEKFNYPFFIVDIHAPLPAFLYLSDTSKYAVTDQEKLMRTYKPGTWILAEIGEITDKVKLSMKYYETKVLTSGMTAYITPAKVPRVIGKAGSMIKMIHDKTGCNIKIGQNGVIWIEGGKIDLVIKVIQKIDDEAHIPGLTSRVEEFISEELKKYGDKPKTELPKEEGDKPKENSPKEKN
ncbi:MAG: RNA-binding protein [Candidatus Aenigmarchaeota archaeon]|nr:RNA-binding protein [Candidatus Aenigmarchaeota archaeon]